MPISASLTLNFKDTIINLVPLAVSILLMILGTIIYIKESPKNGVLIKSLSLIVPVLFTLNGLILNGFKPFRFILAALIFSALFVFFQSELLPEKVKILRSYPVVISNIFLIYAFYVMRKADIGIFIIGLVIGIFPLFFYIKNFIKNKGHIMGAAAVMLSSGFALALALNLPALSVGSFMFPIGAFVSYISSVLYLSFYCKNLNAMDDKFQPRQAIINFLILISSNLFSLGINF